MEFTIRKNILSDFSETFDLIISDDQRGRVEAPLFTTDKKTANFVVNNIHKEMEEALGQHIPWNDMIEVRT